MKKYCLIVAISLALCACAVPASASYYESTPRDDVPFSDMVYTGIDVDAVEAFCRRFVRSPLELYPDLVALYDTIYTQNQLAYIAMCRNSVDEALAAESERSANRFADASDRIYLALSDALAGADGDALAALMPEGQADGFRDYVAMTDEDASAAEEETALIRQYYLLPDSDGFANDAAGLYLRLAELRRAAAQSAGYDSYADYAYAVLYAREYAPEDLQPLRDAVKSRLAPLYARCVLTLDRCPPVGDEAAPPEDQIMGDLSERIGNVSPELSEAMDFLLHNRLYTISDSDAYLDIGYTTALPAYRSAYIFDRTDSRYYAYKDAIHEFGHFNAAYHDPTPMLFQFNSMDVAEIQSQGLEMLFLPDLQELIAPYSESEQAVVALSMLTDMLSSIVMGCLYDEFELTAYNTPGMTVAELHELEQRLLSEYGLDSFLGGEPDWVYVSHLFENPCYYISYAMSAVPALDIWLRAQDDRAAATDAYMRVSAARTDAWFFDVLYDNGLCDPTDRVEIRRFASDLESELSPLLDDAGHRRAPIIIGVCVLLCCTGEIIWLVRQKRKNA